jgi:hypothetical protein
MAPASYVYSAYLLNADPDNFLLPADNGKVFHLAEKMIVHWYHIADLW